MSPPATSSPKPRTLSTGEPPVQPASGGGPAPRAVSPWRALLAAIRPEQWIKNLLVFAALLFSRSLGDLAAILSSLGAFAVFCSAASAIYLFNDLGDREQDRLHPAKRHRPLAAGTLPVSWAWWALTALASAALLGGTALEPRLGLIVLVYLSLNVAYSRWLKREVILDVMIIALGFVLRAWAGGVAIGVTVTPWLLLCTLMLALFLGFGKRRHELALLEDGAHLHRPALGHYSVYYLDIMMTISAGVVVITYALYTLAPDTVARFHTSALIVTTPSVVYGVYRYLYLVHEQRQGGDPARVWLTDPQTLVNVVIWTALVILVVYGPTQWLPW